MPRRSVSAFITIRCASTPSVFPFFLSVRHSDEIWPLPCAFLQVKLSPSLDWRLDVIDSVSSLTLLLLTLCGMFFSIPESSESTHYREWISWLAYLSVWMFSLLAAAALINEIFEIVWCWRLRRQSFLGEDPLVHIKEELRYSTSGLAHPATPALSWRRSLTIGSPSKMPRRKKTGIFKGFLHNNREAIVESIRKQLFSRTVIASTTRRDKQTEGTDVIDVCTSVFHQINMLRFRASMQHLGSTNSLECDLVVSYSARLVLFLLRSTRCAGSKCRFENLSKRCSRISAMDQVGLRSRTSKQLYLAKCHSIEARSAGTCTTCSHAPSTAGVEALSHKKKATFWRDIAESRPQLIDFLCHPDELGQVRLALRIVENCRHSLLIKTGACRNP